MPGLCVAADHAVSGSGGGGAGRAGREVRLRSPLIAENARIRLATPVAKSPAPDASRAAVCGLGSRMAAIALQIGQTQHSALPVAQPSLADPPALR